MIYQVSPRRGRATDAPDWEGPAWRRVPCAVLEHYMGSKPSHFPCVQVKLTHDDYGLHVLFRVEDRYVMAVAQRHQDDVWKDSCVELFFTPGPDTSPGYFNLEMNCGGIMLFHFQPGSGGKRVIVPERDCSAIPCRRSLPRTVDPEMPEPVTWLVEYTVPFSLLENFCPTVRPTHGTTWRANFYKCADASSHPHWLTWAPVTFPRPNFHLPEFFGTLVFG